MALPIIKLNVAEFADKYAKKINKVLVKAIKEAQKSLNQNEFIDCNTNDIGQYGYIGPYGRVMQITNYDFFSRRVYFIPIEKFVEVYATSPKTFLPCLDKKKNKIMLDEIASRHEINTDDLEKVLADAKKAEKNFWKIPKA
jgi:hypothetical protein